MVQIYIPNTLDPSLAGRWVSRIQTVGMCLDALHNRHNGGMSSNGHVCIQCRP